MILLFKRYLHPEGATCKKQLVDVFQPRKIPETGKNTIRDGGSTELLTACTLFVHCLHNVYAVETALHCLDSSTYSYIYCKGDLERYWNGLMWQPTTKKLQNGCCIVQEQDLDLVIQIIDPKVCFTVKNLIYS